MLAWGNRVFSIDAAVCVAAHERARLERLLRYCARPPFALKRLEPLDSEGLVYHLSAVSQRLAPAPGNACACNARDVRHPRR